jgi:hypothetical protein
MRFPLTLRVQQHVSLFRSYYVAAFVTLVLLALALGWSLYREQRFLAMSRWPEVTATIQRAQIDRMDTSRKSGPAWTFNVDMDFSFSVNGMPVTARLIDSFRRPAGSEYASTLAEGKKIQIRYNPHIVSLYPYLY